MQAIDHTRTTFVDPQARELIMTILDAATILKRLLPDEELEHGFEFHWGHFHLSIGRHCSFCVKKMEVTHS